MFGMVAFIKQEGGESLSRCDSDAQAGPQNFQYASAPYIVLNTVFPMLGGAVKHTAAGLAVSLLESGLCAPSIKD